ncbi:MAG: RIP metalloprotease RseP [Alistipes sp.]|nr:RIP metalloprotease RseP [Alistipes sp.]
MTGILIQALQFFASLSMLVLIHEFGHYITARMVGARVDKFYLFFNPWFSLYKRKIGGTEYGIGWLPLGGYVSLYDSREVLMDEQSATETKLEEAKKQLKSARRKGNSEDIARLEAEVKSLEERIEELKEQQRTLEPVKDELRAKKAWQRLIVMIAGVVMNVIFAIGIYSAMLYTWGENYYHNDDMVNGYLFNEEAEALGFVDGDRILTIDGEAIGNVVEINERLLIVDHDLEVEVLRDMEPMTLTLAMNDLVAMRERGGYVNFIGEFVPFVVASVEYDSTKEAGIVEGDRIVAVNGEATADFLSALPLLEAAKGDTAMLTVERNGESVEIAVQVDQNGKIGVRVASVAPRQLEYGFWESIPAGFKYTGKKIASYWEQLVMMVNPDTKLYKEVGGFISIGGIFPEVWNWYNFWNITALLSVMLAIMNLLPIPVLDGGHVLFTLWEIITRRKPSEKFMTIAQNIGFYLLLALLIYANGSDILRLFS